MCIGTLSLWSALSRGTTGHKGLFFEADPLSRLFPPPSFSFSSTEVDWEFVSKAEYENFSD